MILPDIASLQKFVSQNDIRSIERLLTTKVKAKSIKNQTRSYLMLSSHNLKHLNKINDLDADSIMLNLEDGVSPTQKPLALALAMLAIQNCSPEVKVVVRVNPLDSGGIEEIKSLNRVKPDAIRVPKIFSVSDVYRALELIDDGIEIHLSIETKEAFDTITKLKIDPRITTFYLGILDLFADLNLSHQLIDQNNPTCHYILSKFLIDCKIAQVESVGFTFQNHNDLQGFRQWCEFEKKMGYEGKSCISPKQVEIANEVFSNTEAISKAQKIIELFEAKKAQGITGFDGGELGFIDEPIYKDALNIVQKG